MRPFTTAPKTLAFSIRRSDTSSSSDLTAELHAANSKFSALALREHTGQPAESSSERRLHFSSIQIESPSERLLQCTGAAFSRVDERSGGAPQVMNLDTHWTATLRFV